MRMRPRALFSPRWLMTRAATACCDSSPGRITRAARVEAGQGFSMVAAAVALPDNAPHLLVVDDDRRIRDLLSRFLFSEGYRVTTAQTATEARAKLEGLRFDLLILDVMMPGETGFEFARKLRTASSVPILMLTARGEAEARIQGL